MTSFRNIAIAIVLFAAACSPPAGQAPTAQSSAEPGASAEAPGQAARPDVATQTGKPVESTQAAAAAPGGLSPAALVGRWGDNGDCTKDIVFNADGTFGSYNGGTGRWSLNGDRMTMSGAGGVFEVRVQVIDANTLMIQNPDGSIGTSQRC